MSASAYVRTVRDPPGSSATDATEAGDDVGKTEHDDGIVVQFVALGVIGIVTGVLGMRIGVAALFAGVGPLAFC